MVFLKLITNVDSKMLQAHEFESDNQKIQFFEDYKYIPFIAKHLQTFLFEIVTLINLFLQPNALLKPMIL